MTILFFFIYVRKFRETNSAQCEENVSFPRVPWYKCKYSKCSFCFGSIFTNNTCNYYLNLSFKQEKANCLQFEFVLRLVFFFFENGLLIILHIVGFTCVACSVEVRRHETLEHTLEKYAHWERSNHTRCMGPCSYTLECNSSVTSIEMHSREKSFRQRVQQRSLARTHHYLATHTAEGSSCGWCPCARPGRGRRRPSRSWSGQCRANSRTGFLFYD